MLYLLVKKVTRPQQPRPLGACCIYTLGEGRDTNLYWSAG